MSNSFNLQRFLTAQEICYSRVLQELLSGKKSTHWMWYIFPQLSGLGRSHNTVRYGIKGRAEAKYYLEHATLGPRLMDCTMLVCKHEAKSAEQIFGQTDAMKFRSCLTLFNEVDVDRNEGEFYEALQVFFNGQADQLTMNLLKTITN